MTPAKTPKDLTGIISPKKFANIATDVVLEVTAIALVALLNV